MLKRFGAAVVMAVVFHAALLGLTVLSRPAAAPRLLHPSLADRASAIDVIVLTDDESPSSVRSERTSSVDEPSDRAVPQQARVTQLRALHQRSVSAAHAAAELDASASDAEAALAELEPGAEPGAPLDGAPETPSGAGPRIDLGFDGSVMRRAALDARERAQRAAPRATRAPRRRPVFSLGHWSENVVRSVAQKSATWEGRALLTLEWDSKGQLLSVTSSAASSSSDEWQRLAKGLSAQLAARPNVGGQGRGLRLVYLVKSDLVLPENKRSLLPAAKYASAEQLRANNLPPATAISLGVKADGSAATTRVVSVELVRSDAL